MEAIAAFSSQFHDPNSSEPETPLSGPEFFDYIKSRAAELARPIQARFAEGFTVERTPCINDITLLK